MIFVFQDFDNLGFFELPKVKLCRPDRKGIAYLSLISDINFTLKFNDISEMKFRVDSIYNDIPYNSYSLVKVDKVLFADQYGYFIITQCEIFNDGIIEYKAVTAVAYEYILSFSRLNFLQGVIKLYNPTNAFDNTTMLGKFVNANPSWSIGYVDSDLWDIYRTFDVSSVNWLDFLFNDIEEKYLCFIVFDNIAKTVSFYSREKVYKKTNIYISHDNLIDNIKIDEKSDDVFTGLNCFGAGNLDIRRVNPLGTSTIYNFSYYKNKEWLDNDTIEMLNVWEKKVSDSQNNYITILTEYRTQNIKLVALNVELKELENKLKAVEQVIGSKISHGIDNTAEYSDLVNQKNSLLGQIENKKKEIKNQGSAISSVNDTLAKINQSLAFENNFTKTQLDSLKSIIKINDYLNESFIQTDGMSEVEIQDNSQALYEHCLKVLKDICSPAYSCDCELVNFIFLKEYEKFTKQLELGCEIKVEIKENWITKFTLLEVSIDFDNPTNFSMKFSTRKRLDDGESILNKSDYQSSHSNTKVDFDSMIWGEAEKSGAMSQIKEFMSGNFNAAKNALESAEGIGVSFKGDGLHLRKYIDDVLQPKEIWMIDNLIAMSGDNFNTPPKVAIGEFKLPSSENYAWGVNAEFLAGYLICGNQFIFENKDKNSNLTQFRFDSNGAYLYNSKITIENDSAQIKIDPSNQSVFTISGRVDRTRPWEQKIYMDAFGNANFVGKGTFEEGLIGGWQIKKNGLFSPFGDYIRNDGYAKLSLLTLTPSTGTFDGNIYAKNLKAGSLDGWLNDYHFLNNTLNGKKLFDGSVSESKLEATYRDKVTDSLARIEVKADKNSASISSLTTYTNNELGKISSSITYINQEVNYNSSQIEIVAQRTEDNKDSIASIRISVNGLNSEIRLKADTVYVSNQLNAVNAKFNGLSSTYATITQLNGVNAKFSNISASNITSGLLSVSRINMGGSSAKWSNTRYVLGITWAKASVVSSVSLSGGKLSVSKTSVIGQAASANYATMTYIGMQGD